MRGIYCIIFLWICTVSGYGQTVTSRNNPVPLPQVDTCSVNLAWFDPVATPGVVPQFEKLEVGVSLPQPIRDAIQAFILENSSDGINPYLSWEIQLKAQFEKQNSDKAWEEVKTVDGFYYQEYDRVVTGNNPKSDFWIEKGESYNMPGKSFNFRIRASFKNTGKYRCTIEAILPTDKVIACPFEFEVVASDNPGFVEVGENGRYFTLGGETYFPVGQNVTWPDFSEVCYDSPKASNDCTRPVMSDVYCIDRSLPRAYENFEKRIEECARGGINYIRTNMVPWSWDFEYETVGDYTDRLNIAWEMDRFFEQCKKLDIRFTFTLMHQQFYFGNPSPFWGTRFDWNEHEAFGKNQQVIGYKTKFKLEEPVEFLTNEGAQKYFKEKIRYFVARYGYSTNMIIIEMGNEMNQFGIQAGYEVEYPWGSGKKIKFEEYNPYFKKEHQEAIENWHNVMTTYIKQELKADQLTSVSYANGYSGAGIGEKVQIMEYDRSYNLEFVDIAGYHFYPKVEPKNYTSFLGQLNDPKLPYATIGKPILLNEIGEGAFRECAPECFDGFYNSWGVACTGIAGMAIWHYDSTYFPKYNLLQSFMQKHSLDKENFQPYFPSGMSEMQVLKRLRRQDLKGDITYLKSEDDSKAIGIIHNRTWNYYTMRDSGKDNQYNQHWAKEFSCFKGNEYNFKCDDHIDWPEAYLKRSPLLDGNSGNRLLVRGMSGFGSYHFVYYNINNIIPVAISSNGGARKRVEFPEFNDRMVAFTLSRYRNTDLPKLETSGD